jgi:pSer/pThr/pTyr-binding forkhead associated (FHA) protein
MASKTISLRIFLHDHLVATRSFAQEVIKLGRLASSHVQLDDESIGRMHAVIEVGVDGHARLVDLGSPSGTELNGARLERSTALSHGDQLRVGPYRIEVAFAEAGAGAELGEAGGAPAMAKAERPRAASPSAAQARVAVDLSAVEDSSEQVAEVVASFGRSILDVAHVGQTRSRKRSAAPLLGLGGALLVGGLGLFAYEVSQPWEAYTAELAEAHKHHREAPEAPGLGTGSLGLMLALLGLVPGLAGGLRLRDEGLEAYTIGEGEAARFKLSGADLPDPAATALVERIPGGYALGFTPAMTGQIELGGQALALADLVASGRARAQEGRYVVPLPNGAKARVEHGEVRFDVNVVHRGAVVAGRGEIDWPFWGYFGGTATIATAFYLLMRSMPDDALAFAMEDDAGQPRYAAFFHQADESLEVEPAEPEPEPISSKDSSGGEAGSRSSGPEGKMGNPASKTPSGAYQMKGPKDANPMIARTFNPDAAARNAGILGILASQDSHFLASVDGGAFAVGNDDSDLWGNVVGTEAAEAYGTGGMGLVGSGRGGGGNASGLIGLGGAGLMGHGTGTGGLHYGPGGGGGVAGFKDRKPAPPVVHALAPKSTGGVDKDLIRRIVRAHINEVRSCYNAGLTKNPNLAGRVTIQFSIVGNGKVASSVVQENTTKDSAVGNCIAKAVKRWTFPKVQGGGTALVSYPFRLTAG